MAVRLKNDALVVQGSDRWFVTDGLNAVGPVRRDLLIRGIEAGRVPLDSFVRHESWKVWRALADFAERADEAPPELGKSPSPSGESVGVSSLESFESENDESAPRFSDEESLDISEETVEIMALLPSSRDLDEPMAFGFVPTEPHPRLPNGEQPVTQLSQDLLGGDRPTLASYLDDDEETNVPNKPGSMPLAPYPRSAPPPPAPPALSSPPYSPPKVPRPTSAIPPPRGSETAKFTRSGPGKPLIRSAPSSKKAAAPSAPKASVKSQRGTAARRSQTNEKSPPLISSTQAAGSSASKQRESLSFPGADPSLSTLAQLSAPALSTEPRTKASNTIQDGETGDELQGATDLSEALLLLLNGLVRRTRSQVAILHRMADDGATALCAHGPNMVDFLGARTRLLDPAVVAAAGGHVVIAEPVAGSSGEATMQRLKKSGIDVEGAAMFPLRPKGRLMGFVELGKEARFEMRELHEAERLIRVFVTRSEAGEFVR